MYATAKSTQRRGAAIARILGVTLLAITILAFASVAYAVEGEEPAPAGPSEEYTPDPADVVGDEESDAPVPAGPSEDYRADSSDVVGSDVIEEPLLPFTEAVDPDLSNEAFLPFTGANAALLIYAGIAAAAGLGVRRWSRIAD